jgi:hypothetical protein
MAAFSSRGNLEPEAQDLQMRVGIVALATALVVGTLLAKGGVAHGYRALAFGPFFVAGYGVLAALYRTCGLTAIAGRRVTSDGMERVADRDELAALRSRGLRVIAGSALLAATATAVLILAS